MKYLCLICDNETKLQTLPRSAFETLSDEHLAYAQTLRRRGQLVGAETLQPVQSATTVRVREGRLSITDGPFAETQEQLGGFLLIEAADLDEAIRIAAGIPSARSGSIEVRPIRDPARHPVRAPSPVPPAGAAFPRHDARR